MKQQRLQPYYRLSDFPDRKGNGKNWMATCPACGKKHLSISRDEGLYHCFTPGCDFNGQLDEYKPYHLQHNCLGERNYDSSVNTSILRQHSRPTGRTATTRRASSADAEHLELQTDFLPEDYEQLDNTVVRALLPLDRDEEVRRYLDSIGIPVDVASKAGCMAAVKTFGQQQRHCLCYVNRVFGNVINVKYRAVDGKLFLQDAQKAKDAPSAPYNIDCINPLALPATDEEDEPTTIQSTAPLIITEGEKDALTLLAAGYPYVISIPNGAGNRPEVCFAPFIGWLRRFPRVVICGDEDRAGRVMKKNLTTFFASMQTMVAVCRMSHGCKDINEVLCTYGMEEVTRVVDGVEWPKSRDIVRINDDRHGIMEVLNGNYDHGYSLGYGGATDLHLKLTDEGGLIVVTGRPNSGKTDWIRSTLARLMFKRQKRVAFLSFEEPNKRKQILHIMQTAFDEERVGDAGEERINSMLDFLDRHMVNLQMVDTVPTPSNIIALCQQASLDSGHDADFLCVDPYLFIENEMPMESETQQIKSVLTTFQQWARDRHKWVIVIAHPRKLVKDGTGEYEEVDEYSISGSAHWANLADFLLAVKRVFPMGAQDIGSRAPSYTVVNVIKVRDQDICHTGKLYYLRHPSGRYEERPDEDTCKTEITTNRLAYTDTDLWEGEYKLKIEN